MSEPTSSGELYVVRDRRSAQLATRAFPRDPSLADPSNGEPNTVGPESPPTYAAEGVEPLIIDGDEIESRLPTPRFTPAHWSGYPSAWQTGWTTGGGAAGAAGFGGRVSTVFSCTALNANALASMPVSVTEKGRPIDPDEYGWVENPDPRLYASWSEFMVQAVVSLMTRGDLYVHATAWDLETLLPTSFMVVDPDRVTCQFAPDGATRDYLVNGEPAYPFDLTHVRYMTLAGWPTGLSPLQAVAGNLRSAGALEQYGADLADGGGIPWGVLSSEQRLTRRQTALARQQWLEAAQNRRGAPAVLGSGLKLETLTISPKDLALLDLRVFDEQRIAAAFGVPPYLIGLEQPQGLTYANATSLFDFHWRGMLRPLSRKITEALSAWALPRGRKLHLVAGDYVQPPLAERSSSYKAMHERGVLTDDEWRAFEGLPPLTATQRAGRASNAVANTTADSSVMQ
jgi:HK97 family phage portal protein